jgi:hypothetical protein
LSKPSFHELLADSICSVGNVPAVADAPNADLAIFMDGDVTNLEESNILDFNYFTNAYTYEDFLMDYETNDRLIKTCMQLQEKLEQACEVIAKLRQQRSL